MDRSRKTKFLIKFSSNDDFKFRDVSFLIPTPTAIVLDPITFNFPSTVPSELETTNVMVPCATKTKEVLPTTIPTALVDLKMNLGLKDLLLLSLLLVKLSGKILIPQIFE